MSTRSKNTKIFQIRVNEALHSYLKSRKADFWRKVLTDYRDGRLVDISEVEKAKASQSIPVQTEVEPSSTPIVENEFSPTPSPPLLDCIYFAEDPKDPINYLYCDTKRIPISVCKKRRARFSHYDRRCKPIVAKPRRRSAPRKPAQEYRFEKKSYPSNYPTQNEDQIQQVKADAIKRLDMNEMICPKKSNENYKHWITQQSQFERDCAECPQYLTCPVFNAWMRKIG